ncbi:PilZ domain-containing protein [Tahibacter amnicola]|uniref:PilZ domain-containing protein n=1 Tax=Tahibacter amnicola TaxID=2976241 RepID=A0ABY6BBW4_9GAMM|nr:PilZ domain-containing protein [Tahibacter amnicola]UXI67538.1 PilZ domain-containing protein [Tahibacter amnicola]
MNYAEKRRHPRLSVFSAAMLVFGDDGYLSEVKDLSQGGARVALPCNWGLPVGTECQLFLIFDQETVIGLRIRVVRVGGDDLGLEFMPGQEARVASVLYESRFVENE